MNNTTSSRSCGLLDLETRSGIVQAFAVAAGIPLLALASWIEVPMLPVPMTMQTFAVLLVGALYGWRLGALTVAAWLACAALGLPLLAGGAGGVARFAGPTAGYLFAFPVAAALVGWLAARGWMSGFLPATAAVLLGHAVCLGLGATWLAWLIGPDRALAAGVLPFLAGAVLKSALAAAVVRLVAQTGNTDVG
ncbi:biotin transport system substrate-specific component [Constrictibacter sp. MBR-5]|jgi:biotin transport system substrate-specific component|uniref:biotin transporter BioY n=1 Tax=Constrictibacter sp. MBR-5 TaxID=3156467 RepID=UPI00339505FB